ncbi:MAG: class I tRNA ligase family protein, partial [Oscillospiraceae bacterium]
EKIIHQYPHCWRCKKPIIYRATKQWFCSIDGFKDEAIKAIEGVKWIPGWGEDRIKGMVRDRSDWCISRQRTWGVPIPIIYCKDCNKPIVNEVTIDAISELFRKEGSDAWYTKELSEFIPSSVKCECGCGEFTKEMDIMDVWFDSGVTHTAVLEERDNLNWPADLYLEGADQYRGWFQSSLLTSVVWKGTAPYKAVCTHGWVVDGEGRKQSKSLGNGIAPDDIIKEYGADILRLWVASSDYHSDIRISKEILKQLSDAYKKIRNTARFILGNLSNGDGFNPDTDCVSDENLLEIDKLALMKFDILIDKVNAAYENLDYHIVFHSIHNFCVTDMSNFYLDIVKDRLYCKKEKSVERRAAQTTMYRILSGISRLFAPILSFTADEIWKYIPHSSKDDTSSIILNDMPKKSSIAFSQEFINKWNKIYLLRDDAKKALEIKRTDKFIGASLEAKVTIHCADNVYEEIMSHKDELAAIFIVSSIEIVKDENGEFKGDYEGVSFTYEKAVGEKCERCWIYSNTVGKSDNHPTLCERCEKEIE